MGLHRREVPFLPPLGIQDDIKLASHFFLNDHHAFSYSMPSLHYC